MFTSWIAPWNSRKILLTLAFAVAVLAANEIVETAFIDNVSLFVTPIVTAALIFLGANVVATTGYFVLALTVFSVLSVPYAAYGEPGAFKILIGFGTGLAFEIVWSGLRSIAGSMGDEKRSKKLLERLSSPLAGAIGTSIWILLIYQREVLYFPGSPEPFTLRILIIIMPIMAVLGGIGGLLGDLLYALYPWRTELLPEPVLRKLTPISFVGGLLAAIGFIYATFYALIWIRMQPFGQAVLASFFVLTIVLSVVSFCALLYTRGAAGRTVLDLGPSPYRKGFLWMAACALLVGVILLFIVVIKVIDRSEGRNINIDVVDMLVFIMMIVGAVFLLTLALERLQIRGKGIWLWGDLIKWDKIDSYDWDEDFLLVQKKVRFPFGAKVRIRVPPEHKDSVEELLKEHCSRDA